MTAAVTDMTVTTVTTRPEALTPAAARPRLVPVPDCEPPLEPEWEFPHPAQPRVTPGPPRQSKDRRADELPAVAARIASHVGIHTPTWIREAPIGSTPRTQRAHRRHTVVARHLAADWCDDEDMGIQATSTADLPPIEQVSASLARGIVEVLSGCRTFEQLRVHCTPAIFAGLEDAPMLGGRQTTQLLGTRISEPADGVAEVAATFRCAGHIRALAMRLEGIDHTWRLTALELG